MPINAPVNGAVHDQRTQAAYTKNCPGHRVLASGWSINHREISHLTDPSNQQSVSQGEFEMKRYTMTKVMLAVVFTLALTLGAGLIAEQSGFSTAQPAYACGHANGGGC